MQVRLTRGVFSNANDILSFLMIFLRMSLHCKLVHSNTENTKMAYYVSLSYHWSNGNGNYYDLNNKNTFDVRLHLFPTDLV